MKAVIIEKNSMTEYFYKGKCIMVAIKDCGQWMLIDTGAIKSIKPFAAFFRTKKEMEASFTFQIARSLVKIAI